PTWPSPRAPRTGRCRSSSGATCRGREKRMSNHEANPKPGLITRREAILRVSALLGGVTLVGQGAMLAGCQRREAEGAAAPKPLFTAEDVALLDELAETILPETDTPGAKAAAVGP